MHKEPIALCKKQVVLHKEQIIVHKEQIKPMDISNHSTKNNVKFLPILPRNDVKKEPAQTKDNLPYPQINHKFISIKAFSIENINTIR